MDEQLQGHRPAAGLPGGAARQPPPAGHLQRAAAGQQLHPVAVLGIGGLGGGGQGFGAGLAGQKRGREGLRLRPLAQGRGETPGGTGGVAVVVEVEVTLR